MYPALRFWKSAAKNLSANDGSFDSIRLTLWMIFMVFEENHPAMTVSSTAASRRFMFIYFLLSHWGALEKRSHPNQSCHAAEYTEKNKYLRHCPLLPSHRLCSKQQQATWYSASDRRNRSVPQSHLQKGRPAPCSLRSAHQMPPLPPGKRCFSFGEKRT